MKVTIFRERQLTIPDEMVRAYEVAVKPFTPEVAEYLAVSSDCSPDSSTEELRDGIISGIREEIYVYTHHNEILEKAADTGVFKN